MTANTLTYNDPAVIATPSPFRLSMQGDAPVDSVVALRSTTVADTWSRGLTPGSHVTDMEPSSGIVAVIIALIALVAFESQQLRRILSGLDTDLLGVRRRDNAFDSHTTAESRTIALLLLLTCVCEAILLGVATCGPAVVADGPGLAALIALTVGYYIFQWVAYSIIGYTFTDTINTVQWRKGFNLSQAVLGLALLLPAVIVLYYHRSVTAPLIIALILYILARIVFLCKGFRIFYNQLPSLVYFILYLCALELIPVLLVIKTASCVDWFK